MNDDGTITTTNKTEICLYADENSTASWDDVEMTIKMKTNATDLSQMYIRGGVDGTNANYYIDTEELQHLVLMQNGYSTGKYSGYGFSSQRQYV